MNWVPTNTNNFSRNKKGIPGDTNSMKNEVGIFERNEWIGVTKHRIGCKKGGIAMKRGLNGRLSQDSK